jgi:hypothetical protein
VNPEPVVANQTPAATCSDVPLAVNFNTSTSVTAATYNVTALNLNGLSVSAGGAAVGNGLSPSALADDAFTNLTSANVNVVYTVNPVSSAGCVGNPFTITVPIKPEPVGIAGTANSCSDVQFTVELNDADVSNSQAGTTYAWVANANNNVTGEGSGTGNIVQTINNVTTIDQLVTYVITPTGTNLCVGNTFNYVATIKPEPVGIAGTIPTTCSDVQFTVELNIGGNNPIRVVIDLPAVVLTIPSVNTEQVVSTTINFTAQGSNDSNAFDIAEANEVEIKYYAV